MSAARDKLGLVPLIGMDGDTFAGIGGLGGGVEGDPSPDAYPAERGLMGGKGGGGAGEFLSGRRGGESSVSSG